MPVGAVVGVGAGPDPVGAGIEGGVIALGLVVGAGPVVVGAEVGRAVDVDAGALMLQPDEPLPGAPACSHEDNVAISAGLRRPFGGGGMGLVSFTMRPNATAATERPGSLFAAPRKSSALSNVIGTPKSSGGA